MFDLVCERCGRAATYADASQADSDPRDHCGEGIPTDPQVRESHEWVRPMHPGVDVVTG